MPRYFFDICEDGRRTVDDDGEDFSNVDLVALEASQTAAEICRGRARGRWLTGEVAVEVRDSSGQWCFTSTMTLNTMTLKMSRLSLPNSDWTVCGHTCRTILC